MAKRSQPRELRAFVSSTYTDLKDHRAYVIDQLRGAGIVIDPMENWTADGDEPKKFSVERVKPCDLCVLLVAFRRGGIRRSRGPEAGAKPRGSWWLLG